MRIAEAGDVRVRKQEVEGDGEEGQVSHEGEILAAQDDVVHSVGEGEPVQGLAHTVQVGVPDAHGQVVVIQTLRRKDRREFRLTSQMCLFNARLDVKQVRAKLLTTWETFSYSPLDEAKCRTC